MPVNINGNEINSLGAKLLNDTGIVLSNLVLYLDAGIASSYPGSGNTWTDLSGNGNNGTLVNEPTYSSSDGGSLTFDGVDTSVPTSLTRNFDELTCSAWYLYSGGSGERDVIDSIEPTSSEWFRLNVRSGLHAFHIDNDANKTVLEGSSASIGVWYNSVGVWNPTTGSMKLYINGILNAQTTKGQTSTILGLNNVTIGSSSISGEHFNGSIADIKIYDRALSASEVLQNFNATRQRFGV